MIFEEIIKKGKEKLFDVKLSETSSNISSLDLDVWVPGLGGAGCGISFNRNRVALEKYAIKTKLLGDSFTPNTELSIFSKKLSMPIISAPMSGIKTNLRGILTESDFLVAVLLGSNEVGSIGMCGDSFDLTESYIVPDLIKKYGGIAVCKPRKNSEIIKRIELLSEAGAVSIGVDIDGLGGVMLSMMNSVARKNKNELIVIRKSFSGTMFLKGIMSIDDAQIAYDAGFDAIVISNHGGRVMDYSLGVADVLPEICNKFKGKMKIIVDGGVRNGYDVFVYLALGADAVLVGRTILYGVIGAGTDGVKSVLEKLKAELIRAMLFTGCKSLEEINKDLLIKYEK